MPSSLHVRADGLIRNRKSILESAMQSTLLIKSIKPLKALNRKKSTQLTAFKKNLKEISHLIGEFKLRDVGPKGKVIPKVTKKTKQVKIAVPKEKTKIERDLEDIQNKLQGLEF